MRNQGRSASIYSIDRSGILDCKSVYWHLTPPALYEHALRRNEGAIAHGGPLVVNTGAYTGRSPRDTFIVRPPGEEQNSEFGSTIQTLDVSQFQKLRGRIINYLRGRDVYVFDGYVGADARYRMKVRVVTERAWHNLFIQNMLIAEHDSERLVQFVPDFTVIAVPGLQNTSTRDGTSTRTLITICLDERLALVTGTEYGGESKNAIFVAMNYYLPLQGVLPLHCAASHRDNSVTLFVGMSGVGKTTLSAESPGLLLGDDEHAWSDSGIFALEGGCHPTALGLNNADQPSIFAASNQFGTVLENVVCQDETRVLDFHNSLLTRNTCACYPIGHMKNADCTGLAGHPKDIVLLTADTLGVIPPVSRLNAPQALYHFLSGYTAKMPDTELGEREPYPSFSPCFAGPFLPFHPVKYVSLLQDRIDHHEPKLWLVNTGWAGQPYDRGERIDLKHTKRIIEAILLSELDEIGTITDPCIGGQLPEGLPGVPSDLLHPHLNGSGIESYGERARALARMFGRNFEQFKDLVGDQIARAAPRSP